MIRCIIYVRNNFRYTQDSVYLSNWAAVEIKIMVLNAKENIKHNINKVIHVFTRRSYEKKERTLRHLLYRSTTQQKIIRNSTGKH